MYVRMYVCMHACMYVCMNVCMYVSKYVCMYVCLSTCMPVYSLLPRGHGNVCIFGFSPGSVRCGKKAPN